MHDPAAEGVELGELGVDALEHRLQPPLLGLACGSAGVVGGEGVDSVGEGEADRLELAREPDALDGVELVVAVARFRPRRRREHADHAILDAFYALPDLAARILGSLLGRLADGGVDVVEAGAFSRSAISICTPGE